MDIEFRPWQRGDEDSLTANANNYNIWKNVRNRMPFPYTLSDARNWISYNQYMSPVTHFAIIVDGQAVGAVGFELKEDIYCKNAEVGYWLGESFWGKGIATEALQWAVHHIFSNFDIHRIYACVFSNNISSRRVLEKAGFVLEAIHKESVLKEGLFMDECIYSLIRNK